MINSDRHRLRRWIEAEAVWPGQAADALLTLKTAADNARTNPASTTDPDVLAEQAGLFRQAALVAIKDPATREIEDRTETRRAGPPDA